MKKNYKEIVLSCCRDCIKTIYKTDVYGTNLFIMSFGQFCLKDDSWLKLNMVSEICLSVETFNIDFKGMRIIPIFTRNYCTEFLCYDIDNSSYCICEIIDLEDYEDTDITLGSRSQFNIEYVDANEYFSIREITDKEAKKAYKQELKAPLRDELKLPWIVIMEMLTTFVPAPCDDVSIDNNTPTSILLRQRIKYIEKKLSKKKNN